MIPHRYSFGTLRYWKGSLNWNERAMKRPSPKTTSNYQVKTLEPRSWVMITITITIRVFHLVGDYEGVRSISSFGHHGWPVTERGRTITNAKSVSVSVCTTHTKQHTRHSNNRPASMPQCPSQHHIISPTPSYTIEPFFPITGGVSTRGRKPSNSV